ncbi:hypothetical protein D3C86_1808400 [compost metagenome]
MKIINAPVTVNAATVAPPIRFEVDPVAVRTSEGASDAKKPPSAQVAVLSGNTRHKVDRAWIGTCRVGRSDAQAPACKLTVSGRRQTYNACITNSANSTQ